MITRISFVLLSIGVICTAGSLVGCSKRGVGELEKGGRMPEKMIEQVQEDHTDEWMAIPGVEGTAIGLFEDKPCITIFSSKKAEDLRGLIPSIIEGYSVIIEESGTFRALGQQ